MLPNFITGLSSKLSLRRTAAPNRAPPRGGGLEKGKWPCSV